MKPFPAIGGTIALEPIRPPVAGRPGIMKLLSLLLSLCGCSSVPTWSDASLRQRQDGYFRPDSAYLHSDQYRTSIAQSSETVNRLRQQLKNQ